MDWNLVAQIAAASAAVVSTTLAIYLFVENRRLRRDQHRPIIESGVTHYDDPGSKTFHFEVRMGDRFPIYFYHLELRQRGREPLIQFAIPRRDRRSGEVVLEPSGQKHKVQRDVDGKPGARFSFGAKLVVPDGAQPRPFKVLLYFRSESPFAPRSPLRFGPFKWRR